MKKPASKAFAMIESPKLELKANEKNLSLTMELFIKTVLSSSEYIDKFNEVDEKYAQEILNEVFKEENMVLSIVK